MNNTRRLIQQTKHPSRSDVQQKAGKYLVKYISSKLGVELIEGCPPEQKLPVQIDGYCMTSKPPILCEAWAHIGSPQGGQPDKVMNDALKLISVEKSLRMKCTKILIFADGDAMKPFSHDSSSWRAKCLGAFKVECRIGKLPPRLKRELEEAQKRQGKIFKMGATP